MTETNEHPPTIGSLEYAQLQASLVEPRLHYHLLEEQPARRTTLVTPEEYRLGTRRGWTRETTVVGDTTLRGPLRARTIFNGITPEHQPPFESIVTGLPLQQEWIRSHANWQDAEKFHHQLVRHLQAWLRTLE